MPQVAAYLLRIWRSQTVRGWQWAARLEHLGGESRLFSDPEALLAFLREVLWNTDGGALLSPHEPSGAPAPPETGEDDDTHESS
jgi:hypothetical protein